MLICRTTLNPDAPAEIVDSDDGVFYVERMDRRPWRYDWEWTHGGWCMFPCYTAAVRRSQIVQVVQIAAIEEAAEDMVNMTSFLPAANVVVVDAPAFS